MNLSIVQSYNSVSKDIEGIIRALGFSGRRKLLMTVASEFVKQTKSNMGGAGDKYKEKRWPSLSPKYAKRVGRSEATLKVSGNLQGSIQMGAPRSNWIEVFTKNPYAAAHTFGSKKTRLPARNFWPVQFFNPTYSRPLFNSEKDMIAELSKRLVMFSGGVLPRLSTAINRSPPQYGNVFSAPQGTK